MAATGEVGLGLAGQYERRKINIGPEGYIEVDFYRLLRFYLTREEPKRLDVCHLSFHSLIVAPRIYKVVKKR